MGMGVVQQVDLSSNCQMALIYGVENTVKNSYKFGTYRPWKEILHIISQEAIAKMQNIL